MMMELRGTQTIKILGPALLSLALGAGCMGVLEVDDLSYHTECTPNKRECDGNTLQVCGADGLLQSRVTCDGQTCKDTACVGECEAGALGCVGRTPRACNAAGQWENGDDCPTGCADGLCIAPRSCEGIKQNCGPSANLDCCAGTLISGGSFQLSNEPTALAVVSNFEMNRFEVTVARFRKFVEAYPGSQPNGQMGAHPAVPESGWNEAWASHLPESQDAFKNALKCGAGYETWMDTSGANDNKPINCVTWYEAFAFCAWDGGRLPTEAEWNYAAAGGNEQRQYPWSDPPESTAIDKDHAVFDCTGDGSTVGQCGAGDIADVGTRSPLGDGRWGQSDLSGNVWEWAIDGYGAYGAMCTDCIKTSPSLLHVVRGGSWNGGSSYQRTSYRSGALRDLRSHMIGIRCVRDR